MLTFKCFSFICEPSHWLTMTFQASFSSLTWEFKGLHFEYSAGKVHSPSVFSPKIYRIWSKCLVRKQIFYDLNISSVIRIADLMIWLWPNLKFLTQPLGSIYGKGIRISLEWTYFNRAVLRIWIAPSSGWRVAYLCIIFQLSTFLEGYIIYLQERL